MKMFTIEELNTIRTSLEYSIFYMENLPIGLKDGGYYEAHEFKEKQIEPLRKVLKKVISLQKQLK